ncbi:DNA polymerase epsilon subunit B [Glycine max]|nr:DNA polymerase epsilon subunit B [Glycine max]
MPCEEELFQVSTCLPIDDLKVANSKGMNNFNFLLICGFPPLEDRDKSLEFLSGHDFLDGGIFTKEETATLLCPSLYSAGTYLTKGIRLREMEKGTVNDMFVILADIWLDNEEALRKLETVLDDFESVEVVPSLFVFMGNFSSKPCNRSFHSNSSLSDDYKSETRTALLFGKLGEMIASHPRLKEHSKLLIIPGPDDAGPSTALPRCALPNYLTEELQKHIPHAIFSSNPFRVKFYTQEILVATITHQSHLCPLPLTVQPNIWNYDHCLYLYPTPHTIVLGDRSLWNAFKNTGITYFNTSSFSIDSTSVAYCPCSQEVKLLGL